MSTHLYVPWWQVRGSSGFWRLSHLKWESERLTTWRLHPAHPLELEAPEQLRLTSTLHRLVKTPQRPLRTIRHLQTMVNVFKHLCILGSGTLLLTVVDIYTFVPQYAPWRTLRTPLNCGWHLHHNAPRVGNVYTVFLLHKFWLTLYKLFIIQVIQRFKMQFRTHLS